MQIFTEMKSYSLLTLGKEAFLFLSVSTTEDTSWLTGNPGHFDGNWQPGHLNGIRSSVTQWKEHCLWTKRTWVQIPLQMLTTCVTLGRSPTPRTSVVSSIKWRGWTNWPLRSLSVADLGCYDGSAFWLSCSNTQMSLQPKANVNQHFAIYLINKYLRSICYCAQEIQGRETYLNPMWSQKAQSYREFYRLSDPTLSFYTWRNWGPEKVTSKG